MGLDRMHPDTVQNLAIPEWKQQFRSALRTASQLAEHGLIPADQLEAYDRVLQKYALFLPLYYVSLIDRMDPACPIQRQAVPELSELEARTEALADPLGDLDHRPAPRLTHRYQGRALLHLTVNCPMYCRYCFRKTLLNENADEFFSGNIDPAIAYLENAKDIHEVILSGGDPLMVTDAGLTAVFERLGKIKHLRRIRIHSRAPVTMPARIDAGLVKTFQRSLLPIVLVTHFNHPREITPQSQTACEQLRANTHSLLNQSVLLKGVNDSVQTLQSLCEGLFDTGVTPYYLHQLDRTEGTLHFEVPIEQGKQIHALLRERLPGYLVPRYVIDRGDRSAKHWL